MTNIGMTCLEELGDLDDVIGGETPRKTTRRKSTPKARTTISKPQVEQKPTAAKEEEPKTEPAKSTRRHAKSEPEEPKQETGPLMSEAQKRAVYNLSRRRGIPVEELEGMVQEAYGTSLENLTSKDASTFIRQLQQAA